MKYIKPPDFKSVKEFQEFYKKIETDITKLLTTDGSARTANELQDKLKQALEAAAVYLARKNESFVRNELPKAFEEGKDSAKAETKLTAKEANAILEKQGFKYAKNAFKSDTYIELQSAVKSAGNGLNVRINKIIKDLHKQGKDTIYNVQQEIVKDLQQNGILAVEYSNGAKQPLHSYAAMAARSARIESQNIGAIGRALQNGTDYVKMTFVPQCCKLCGAYQDKVYSISGKDKRFPALFKTVLRSGYALPHPNCRHEFIPFYLDMESEEDIKKAIARSKIKYDKNGDLVDVRYQADIKGYAAWQAGNRQLNTEYKEFEQMQAYYKAKGETPPYTSLGAFRRARRAQAQSYKDNHKKWSKLADQPIEEKVLPYNEVVDSYDYRIKFKGLGNKTVVRNVCKEARKCIHKNDKTNNERGVYIDEDGNTVFTFSGSNRTADYLGFKMSNHKENSLILVHNHPSGKSFSYDDILTICDHPEIKTIIAVGHNGNVYQLSIGDGERLDKDARAEYNKIMRDTNYDVHATMLILSKTHGWSYKKI